MNATHVHLLLTHLPIFGTLIASAIMGWGIYRKNTQFKNFGAVLVIALAVCAFIVDNTGESAEHAIRKMPGITHDAIEAHEHAATPAFITTLLAGFFCAIYLIVWYRKLPMQSNLFIACTVLTFVAFVLMARAGYFGGQIRHGEEISAMGKDSINIGFTI